MKSKPKKEPLTLQIQSAQKVKVFWLYEGETYIYTHVPGSIVGNSKAQSLRFELTEVNGGDDNFEVVVQKSSASYIFKTDYYDDAYDNHPLKLFTGQEELILYFEDGQNHVYFHLS
jgi:hypothetical protein